MTSFSLWSSQSKRMEIDARRVVRQRLVHGLEGVLHILSLQTLVDDDERFKHAMMRAAEQIEIAIDAVSEQDRTEAVGGDTR